MLTFKHLRYKNFLSTGNQFIEIPLNKQRTNIIVGDNGSGKSTMLDALCFSLFNRPFRKITKSQIVNSQNDKDCLVEIDFDINKIQYKVKPGEIEATEKLIKSFGVEDIDAQNLRLDKNIPEVMN